MKKFNYYFMRPALGFHTRSPLDRPAVERIQCASMEFSSDADANKYARIALGHNCFAIREDVYNE